MEVKQTTNHPIVKTWAESLPRPLIDRTAANTYYYGWAALGTPTSKAAWRIMRVTREGQAGFVETPEFASGDDGFNHIWDDRTTLQYSR